MKGNTMERKNTRYGNCKGRAVFIKTQGEDKRLIDRRYFQYYKGSSLWALDEVLQKSSKTKKQHKLAPIR